MKRITALLFLTISLISCSSNNTNENADNSTNENVEKESEKISIEGKTFYDSNSNGQISLSESSRFTFRKETFDGLYASYLNAPYKIVECQIFGGSLNSNNVYYYLFLGTLSCNGEMLSVRGHDFYTIDFAERVLELKIVE